jgi:hypothetical protein
MDLKISNRQRGLAQKKNGCFGTSLCQSTGLRLDIIYPYRSIFQRSAKQKEIATDITRHLTLLMNLTQDLFSRNISFMSGAVYHQSDLFNKIDYK